MNPQPSPAIISNPAIAKRQRWLSWNVPRYVAALCLRHAKSQTTSRTGVVWDEIQWPTDCVPEAVVVRHELDQSTCVWIGIDRHDFYPMLENLSTLKEQAVVSGNDRHGAKIYLVVVCFECDEFLKSTLLELGADLVVDRMEIIPSITGMIAKNGRAFPAAPHPFLPHG